MTVTSFPPVQEADQFGLLAIGGDLEVDSLLLAYKNGIFPWPLNESLLTWFAPHTRAILWLDDFKPGRTLKKELRKSNWRFAFDTRFEEVIASCARSKNRRGQKGTWITKSMIRAYRDFHRAGYCHSIEAFYDGELAGGLYGVAIGGMFAGESMFYTKPNASKLALAFLVEHLKGKNVRWLDCQVLNPFLESLGAVELEQHEFMKLLKVALAEKVKLF